MKITLTTLVLLGAIRAFGQTSPAPEPTYSQRQSLTPTFKSLADTAGTGNYISLGQSITILRKAAPGWVAIQRGNKELFVASRHLQLNKVDEVAVAPPLPIDAGTGLVTFSEVIQAPGLTQNELYTRGKVWFINNFAKGVVQNQEKDAGLLIGRAWTPRYVKTPFGSASGKLWYTVRLSFKDGRYKYEMSSFTQEAIATNNNPRPDEEPIEKYFAPGHELAPTTMFGKMQNQQRQQVHDTAARLLASLKEAMGQPANGDW